MNESLETADIYVDTKNGSDSNNGSKTSPLKAIGASVTMALNNNHANIGSRVIINPGTYREAAVISGGGNQSTNLPMTFEAATNGTVFVSGADLMTGWTTFSGNSKISQNNWPYDFGICPNAGSNAPFEQEIVLRAEMIVVNGTPLTQVLSLTSMLPGTFFVDDKAALVYVYPPSGTNMSTATVEVATRPSIWQISGQSNIVVRGLTFQYANTCHGTSAVEVDGNTNTLFDTDSFLWNNAMGVAFNSAEYYTVQNSVAHHNGELGFHSHQAKYDLWQSDMANYNNWRGVQGAFYTWDTGGAKWMWDHTGTYKAVSTLFNQANGVAWDTDQETVTVAGLVSADNLGNGIQIEKSEGPVTVTNSDVCYNNSIGITQRGGIVVRNSEGVTISGTAMYDNGTNQLAVVGQPGGIQIANWETGQSYNLLTMNLNSSANILYSTVPSVFSDSYLGGADWTTFVGTLKSNLNAYYAGSNASVGAFAVPTPVSGTLVDFSAWKSLTGQDASSNWTSANAPAACSVQAVGQDFWLATNTYDGATVDVSGHATFNVNAFALAGLTGNIALTSDGISSVPGLTASFSPSTITTTGSSVLTVAASPSTVPGTYPVTILGNQGNITRTITLSLVVPKTSVRLSAAGLTFAAQKVDTTSPAQVITLTNEGSTALSISGISIKGNYAQTNTCGTSVKAGGSCAISVTFTPKVVGATNGLLTITDSDATSPQRVTLSGTGSAAAKISISPLSVYFGGQKVGTTGQQVVTLKNVGTATLTISSMKISGTNSGDFKSTSTCGSSVAVGSSCSVQVTFAPGAKGTRSGALLIYDNDGYQTSPQTINLTGTGT